MQSAAHVLLQIILAAVTSSSNYLGGATPLLVLFLDLIGRIWPVLTLGRGSNFVSFDIPVFHPRNPWSRLSGEERSTWCTGYGS